MYAVNLILITLQFHDTFFHNLHSYYICTMYSYGTVTVYAQRFGQVKCLFGLVIHYQICIEIGMCRNKAFIHLNFVLT